MVSGGVVLSHSFIPRPKCWKGGKTHWKLAAYCLLVLFVLHSKYTLEVSPSIWPTPPGSSHGSHQSILPILSEAFAYDPGSRPLSTVPSYNNVLPGTNAVPHAFSLAHLAPASHYRASTDPGLWEQSSQLELIYVDNFVLSSLPSTIPFQPFVLM